MLFPTPKHCVQVSSFPILSEHQKIEWIWWSMIKVYRDGLVIHITRTLNTAAEIGWMWRKKSRSESGLKTVTDQWVRMFCRWQRHSKRWGRLYAATAFHGIKHSSLSHQTALQSTTQCYYTHKYVFCQCHSIQYECKWALQQAPVKKLSKTVRKEEINGMHYCLRQVGQSG